VRDPQVIEHPQRRPGEVAQLRVVAFGLNSVTTTTGSTTSCSANLVIARGSDNRTDVSRT
jgi:hypothetical protein